MNGDIPDLAAVRAAAEARKQQPPEQLQPLQGVFGHLFDSMTAWNLQVLKGQRQDGQPCLYLVIETAVGRLALPCSGEEAAAIGRLIIRESTGLALPQ